MRPSPNAVDQDELILSDDGRQHCERCGYTWRAQGTVPLQCALCRSNYYRRPLKMKDPILVAELQRQARVRAEKRRVREAKQAKIKRLRRVAKELGRESIRVVEDMFAMPPVPPRSMTRVSGMPPPPKFDED